MAGEIAAEWRVRLEKARAAYEYALAEFRRSAEECSLRESDGAGDEDLLQAIHTENAARRHYVEVLKTFTDLVVNGEVPREG